MSLADLNAQLHSRDKTPDDPGLDHSDEPVEAPSIPVIPPETALPVTPTVPLGDAWGGREHRSQPVAPGIKPRSPWWRLSRKVVLLIGAGVLVLAAAGILYRANGWLFNPENVLISVSGPKWTKSNVNVEYVIHYENNNWVDLDEAELIITYPEMFRPTPTDGLEVNASRAVLKLGTVKKSSLNDITLKGNFRSFQNQVALITVTLRAAPSGVSGRMDTQYQYSVAVESSALVMELVAPQQAGDNQSTDYVVTYRNDSTETIENLELVIHYPEGFLYREADPVPTRDENRWSIPSLAPGASGRVTARGIITGEQDDVKRVLAQIGVRQGDDSLLSYAEIEQKTHISASPLSIVQIVTHNNNQGSLISPGENLTYRLRFQNDGDVGLRDVIVTVDLDPRYFDVRNVSLGNGGAYNPAKRQVIFRAGDRRVLSLLEPGRGGEISFSVPVRSDLTIYGRSNLEVETIARIDSPDVPTPLGANKIIASDRVAFKVRTTPRIDVYGFHFDSYGNTGPIPPVVGQETTYTLFFQASSSLNAIENAHLSFAVAGQVRYLKTQMIDQGTVTYNDRTGEIAWNIGTISPGGTRSAKLAIQIGFTPDLTQAGKVARLTNTVVYTGRDAWTGETVRRELPAKTSELAEDGQLTALHGGEVQPSNE